MPFDQNVRSGRIGPCVETGNRPMQNPASRVQRRRRTLSVMKQPCGDLQQDLRLTVAAHGAEYRRE